MSQRSKLNGLIKAARPFTETGVNLYEAQCHFGIVPLENCERCGRVIALRIAVAIAEERPSLLRRVADTFTR